MTELRPARVAMIDDNPDDILLARLSLRRAKLALDFERFATGEQFLEAMERDPSQAPDLALVDLNLPMLRGAQVLSRAHDAAWSRATVFGVCSGSGDPADRTAALEAGAAFFLGKPLNERSIEMICAAAPRFRISVDADGARRLMIGAGR
jgi:CheY-like chemotaxis protein